MKNKQIFHHFSKWEDYKAGFYESTCEDVQKHIQKSIDLLSNQKEFEKYANIIIILYTHNFFLHLFTFCEYICNINMN